MSVTSSIQIPITLRPNRTKAAWLLILSLIFVVIGIFMIRDGKLMGYYCAGFFGLCLPVFALQFHPKAAYLRLDSDGFTFCSLFRAQTFRWVDVRDFAVISIALNQMVAWNFTPDYPATRRVRAISKSLSGYEAALPDTYGLKAQELADLMENLRQKYVDPKC